MEPGSTVTSRMDRETYTGSNRVIVILFARDRGMTPRRDARGPAPIDLVCSLDPKRK